VEEEGEFRRKLEGKKGGGKRGDCERPGFEKGKRKKNINLYYSVGTEGKPKVGKKKGGRKRSYHFLNSGREKKKRKKGGNASYTPFFFLEKGEKKKGWEEKKEKGGEGFYGGGGGGTFSSKEKNLGNGRRGGEELSYFLPEGRG